MTKLSCTICGGSLEMDIDGTHAFCTVCGMGYSFEHLKEQLSLVDSNTNIALNPNHSLHSLAQMYIAHHDFVSAQNIVMKILEHSSSDCVALDLYHKLQDWKHLEVSNGVLVRYHGNASHLVLPDGITQIGATTPYARGISKIDNAFSGCTSLISITLPNSVQRIETCAFKDCSSLTQITLSDTLTSIGSAAFEGCYSISDLYLPTSLRSIGEYAFSRCGGLKDLTLPPNLQKIGNGAFAQSGLKSIVVPNSVLEYGSAIFDGCRFLTNVSLPETLKLITTSMFRDCCSLFQISIPNEVSCISECAFQGCTTLNNLTIPLTVKKIGRNAFAACESLSTVTHSPSLSLYISVEEFNPDGPDRIRFHSVFEGSPYAKVLQSNEWRKGKKCQHCGGSFSGWIFPKCQRCKRDKDY